MESLKNGVGTKPRWGWEEPCPTSTRMIPGCFVVVVVVSGNQDSHLLAESLGWE